MSNYNDNFNKMKNVISGQITDHSRAVWTVLAIILLVIWLCIFSLKTVYFNNKKYGNLTYLESFTNKGELTYILLIGAFIFFLLVVSWNPALYLGLIGLCIAIWAIFYIITTFIL